MKLLFDANLSPGLSARLQSEYPGSTHVRDVGLRGGTDAQIWEYAKTHGFSIVSKDTDFRERSFVEGFPPKVVWLDVGNAATAPIEELLRREQQRHDAGHGEHLTNPEDKRPLQQLEAGRGVVQAQVGDVESNLCDFFAHVVRSSVRISPISFRS